MSKRDRDFLKTVLTARECSTVEECVKTLEKLTEYSNRVENRNKPYPECIVRRRKSVIAKMRKLNERYIKLEP